MSKRVRRITLIVWALASCGPTSSAKPRPQPHSAEGVPTTPLELPRVDGESFDPVALVRVTNRLQRLERAAALQALERFRESSRAKHESADGVFLLVRTAFECDAQFTPPLLGAPSGRPPDAKLWPRYPIALSSDLPFLLVSGYVLGGLPEDPSAAIAFARAHCRLRARPLSPAGDPLAIVDAVISRDPWLASPAHSAERSMLRRQALRAVGRALGTPLPLPDSASAVDANWAELRSRATSHGLHWNAADERYEAGSALPTQPGGAGSR